jgi:hypothetical protein
MPLTVPGRTHSSTCFYPFGNCSKVTRPTAWSWNWVVRGIVDGRPEKVLAYAMRVGTAALVALNAAVPIVS